MRAFVCPDCGLPFAQITDGNIVIRARHHSRTHVCTIYVSRDILAALLDQTEEVQQRRREKPHLKATETAPQRDAET